MTDTETLVLTAAEIVHRLGEMGVRVMAIDKGQIKLTADKGALPPAALDLAKPRKAELIEFLSRSCSPHNIAANYIEAPSPHRRGWIRTTCRRCGKFIGHRPEDAK